MLVEKLGETIRNRRKELSITQPHLAELAKISTNTLYKLERGKGNPSFDVLNKYFTISRMPVVSSQYWNGTHGNESEEVQLDKEGLQIMRTLGRNMAWLLKCIDVAKTTVPYPEREPGETTSFIR